MPRFTSVEEVLASLQAKASPRADSRRRMSIRLICRGEGGGSWHVEVRDGQLDFRRDHDAAADVTVTCSVKDWLDIANGQLDPTLALLTGRVALSGGFADLARLRTLFGL